MYICIYIFYIYIYKEIYYKKLAHAFMDTLTLTKKSHDLQLSSWRPRAANGIVPI